MVDLRFVQGLDWSAYYWWSLEPFEMVLSSLLFLSLLLYNVSLVFFHSLKVSRAVGRSKVFLYRIRSNFTNSFKTKKKSCVELVFKRNRGERSNVGRKGRSRPAALGNVGDMALVTYTCIVSMAILHHPPICYASNSERWRLDSIGGIGL